MTDPEKEVREYWEFVKAQWMPAMPDRFRIEMVYDSHMVWDEITGCGLPKTDSFLTEQRAWVAAYEYTIAHKQKRAELEEEIALQESLREARTFLGDNSAHVIRRTLARLQQALADHMRGTKEGKP